MLAEHDFREEKPERIWFASCLNSLGMMAKEHARSLGTAAHLEILHTDDLSDRDADTFLCLSVDDLFVPYRLKRENYLSSPLVPDDLKKAIRQRLAEIVRAYATLAARTRRLLSLAQRQVELVGHGARLTRFLLEPQDLFYPETPLSKRYFILAYAMLDRDLEVSTISHFVRTLSDVRFAFNQAAIAQAHRHQILQRRKARPGWTEVSDVAAMLMQHGGVTPGEWIAGKRLPTQLEIEGATFRNVAVYRDCMQFQPSFMFEGGYWVADRLVLDGILPDIVRASLVGRRVNEIVQGGLFDRLDHRICAMVERDDRTELVVESRFVWLPEIAPEETLSSASPSV